MILVSNNYKKYLEKSVLYDFTFPPIVEICDDIQSKSLGQIDLIKNIFEFTRDEIKHTVDTNNHNVPCSASEVILHKHGICCAKANLFVAFLRYFKIPVGFCYQRLVSHKKDSFDLHCLNAVYIKESDKWIRLDVGGFHNGLKAKFCIEKENLAFKIDPTIGELDHDIIYAKPNRTAINILKKSTSTEELWKNWVFTSDAVFSNFSKIISANIIGNVSD